MVLCSMLWLAPYVAALLHSSVTYREHSCAPVCSLASSSFEATAFDPQSPL